MNRFCLKQGQGLKAAQQHTPTQTPLKCPHPRLNVLPQPTHSIIHTSPLRRGGLIEYF